MLRKIIDCKSLEISQENSHDGVPFSKVASLQRSEGNVVIKRTHQGFFLEYVRKTSCLENNKREKSLFILRKVFIVDQSQAAL